MAREIVEKDTTWIKTIVSGRADCITFISHLATLFDYEQIFVEPLPHDAINEFTGGIRKFIHL